MLYLNQFYPFPHRISLTVKLQLLEENILHHFCLKAIDTTVINYENLFYLRVIQN